jgi:hypothetical protein
MDVEKFVRHLCRLVLRHQMPVWNYFVNSFYSVRYRNAPVADGDKCWNTDASSITLDADAQR